jgi:hypothetical protein
MRSGGEIHVSAGCNDVCLPHTIEDKAQAAAQLAAIGGEPLEGSGFEERGAREGVPVSARPKRDFRQEVTDDIIRLHAWVNTSSPISLVNSSLISL